MQFGQLQSVRYQTQAIIARVEMLDAILRLLLLVVLLAFSCVGTVVLARCALDGACFVRAGDVRL